MVDSTHAPRSAALGLADRPRPDRRRRRRPPTSAALVRRRRRRCGSRRASLPARRPAAVRRSPARGARVTVVVEPPALPVPGAQIDPRQEALATVLDELDGTRRDRRPPDHPRRGWPRPEARPARPRAAAPASRGTRVPRSRARPRRGGGRPRPVSLSDDTDARVHRALVETDLVVVVSAAETILHGGPGALLSACRRRRPFDAPRRRARSCRQRESRRGSSRSPSSAPSPRRSR